MRDDTQIDLTGLTIYQLNLMHWRMGVVLQHLEEMVQLEPFVEPSKTAPETTWLIDLTPAGIQFDQIREWFQRQMNRIVDTMETTVPTDKTDTEVRREHLLTRAVNRGESMETIAAMALSFADEVRT
ncbi:hypothetical protein EV217_2879 [Phyllobacterium myrsinacearum]|uniref:hypothetical protein n=1 Tax=Phyllobacterium myrsinacearum TaxID=28101 RepID=UPI001029C024|nr:hypothetical protein [Phyllobacterium myrsinacearum]RZS82066.1 hypothetical protein EV217_2879 [Phyllobacterium myrsinacearum]